jgi:hypothetical protein
VAPLLSPTSTLQRHWDADNMGFRSVSNINTCLSPIDLLIDCQVTLFFSCYHLVMNSLKDVQGCPRSRCQTMVTTYSDMLFLHHRSRDFRVAPLLPPTSTLQRRWDADNKGRRKEFNIVTYLSPIDLIIDCCSTSFTFCYYYCFREDLLFFHPTWTSHFV